MTESIWDSVFFRVAKTVSYEDDQELKRICTVRGFPEHARSSKSDWKRPRYESATKRKSILPLDAGTGCAEPQVGCSVDHAPHAEGVRRGEAHRARLEPMYIHT